MFASDLCAEEIRAETEGGVVSEGEEGVVRGSPALKHKEIDHQHQKGSCTLYMTLPSCLYILYFDLYVL